MCAFEINFFSLKSEYHRFSTDDFALLEIGFGNYNLSSIDKLLSIDSTEPLNPDIAEFFNTTSKSNIKDELIGKNDTSTMQIFAYDDVDKRYKLRTGWNQIKRVNTSKYKQHLEPPDSNLEDFLESWNDVQAGIINNPRLVNGYNLVAHRIQNSLSGCITFNAQFNILGVNPPRPSQIKVFILESKDNDSSRTVSLNGSPLISAIPQTSEGMKYGYSNTNNAGVGVYEKPSSEGDNPKDKVAGQLRLAWDPSTKTWESGTQQILVRLIDSIDAPEIPKMTKSELLSLTQEQVYNVKAEDNPIMGRPTKGRALVLSIENGNPNLFGPNFKGACNDNKKSIIMAVNRSLKSFKEGAVVICSHINGEWIITSEGDPAESQKKLTFGRFEYQQYILPTNLFFTSPSEAKQLMPNSWVTKIRNDYYIKSLAGNTDLLKLNLIAQSIASSSAEKPEDLAKLITEKFLEEDDDELLPKAKSNSTVDGISALEFFNNKYCTGDDIYRYLMPVFEHEYAVPKNVSVRSNVALNLGLPNVVNVPEDYIDKNEIPLFWGALFTDGYKSSQTSKFILDDRLGLKKSSRVIFNEDPNLKELSVAAGISLPTFENEQLVYRYVENSFIDADRFDPLSLTRETGGIYKNVSILDGVINDIEKLDGYISFSGINSSIETSRIVDSIYGLEPVNPRKMQFTPMSIDFMYMNSSLAIFAGETKFTLLKKYADTLTPAILPSSVYDGESTVGGYAEFLFSNNSDSGTGEYSDEAFPECSYNIKPLSFSEAFKEDPNKIRVRHPAPTAVVDGNQIVPEFMSNRRSPAIPIMAVKSVVKTSADALSFDVVQYFGNPQQKTVSAGQGPTVTILPIGPGIGWNTPNDPVKVNSFPQWGDSTRDEDIDSLGTLALHARIFEHWPEQQTIFLGPIYTPLHFNPGIEDDGFDYSWTQEDGIIKEPRLNDDDPPKQVDPSSSVDFKEPTRKDGSVIGPPGAELDFRNLAEFSNWKTNTIRRSKLLSDGGFACFRNVIAIYNVSIKTQSKGSNYVSGDEFLFPDGTTFKVVVSGGGQITGIYDLKFNYHQNIIIDPKKYSEITSVGPSLQEPLQPDYLGTSGRGAKFNVDFKIVRMVQYDPAPQEVCPRTRLTSKSNQGAGVIDSINTTTLSLSSDGASSLNEFDIFYFFHNDPTMYSIGPVLFNNSNAQYIISQISPA